MLLLQDYIELFKEYFPIEIINIICEYIFGCKKYNSVLNELCDIINVATWQTCTNTHIRIMEENDTPKQYPYAYNMHYENIYIDCFKEQIKRLKISLL